MQTFIRQVFLYILYEIITENLTSCITFYHTKFECLASLYKVYVLKKNILSTSNTGIIRIIQYIFLTEVLYKNT